MSIDELIQRNYDEHVQTFESARQGLLTPVREAGLALAGVLRQGGTVFWCGNGGSAADSQHLAAELVGRFKRNRRPLRSLALTTDTSVLTCVTNDFCYEDVFSRQVDALGRKGDALVGISTSGNSENVNRAFRSGRQLEMLTIGLLGKGGGPAKALADHVLLVPSETTARIQEVHIFIGHLLCEVIEQELGFAAS